MIRLALIIAIIISISCGSYALVLLGRLRKIYKLDFLNSFLYYEFLRLGFGLYGIIGGIAIKGILLRYDLQSEQIESIVVAIPFLGIPFIIAAWYLLIKMSNELAGKRVPQFISIVYFGITTVFFLVYGLVLRNSTNPEAILPDNISQSVRVVFYSTDLLVKIYAASVLFGESLKMKQHEPGLYLKRMALFIPGLAIMSSLALNFTRLHPIIGIYFLLLFFGSDLVIIIITRAYLVRNRSRFEDVTDRLEDLYQRYGISKREREVISEISQGLTNQQIADKLFISLQTVKDHTHNIFRKVNVSNRVQLTQVFAV